MSEEKSFLNTIPSVVITVTAVLLCLSFLYNYVYFYLLDININLLPLTLQDYTLTINAYISTFVIFSCGALASLLRKKGATKMLSQDNDNTLKNVIVIALMSPMIIGSIYNITYINTYYFDTSVLLIIALGFFVLNLNYIFNFFICFLLIISMIIGVAKSQIVDSFEFKEGYLSTKSNERRILRTFEKGILVFNEELEPVFLYNNEEMEIHFPKNEELIEYIEILKNPEHPKKINVYEFLYNQITSFW